MLLALVLAAGCQDSLVPVESPAPRGAGRNATVQPANWRGYWHFNHNNDLELWVYDTRPTLGVNTSYHDVTALDRMAGIHTRLMRTKMHWYNPPPAGDTLYYYMLQGAASRGMELVIQVDEIADAETKPQDYDQRQAKYHEIANRVVDLMRKYPTVRFWQIGNEPDAGCDSGQLYGGGTTTDRGTMPNTFAQPDRYSQGWNYAEMLKVVYPRMQAEAEAQSTPTAKRQVTVITAGLTGEEGYTLTPDSGNCVAENASGGPGSESWEFLTGIYNNGGARFFDVLAIHTYGETAGGLNSFVTSSNAVRNKIQYEFGDGGRPIWITEFGTSAELNARQLNLDGPSRDPEQADSIQEEWYRDALAYQAGSGYLPVVMAYNLWSEIGGIPSAPAPDYGFGLVRENWTPRPAYNHLAGLSYLQAPVSEAVQDGVFALNTTAYVPLSRPFEYLAENLMEIRQVRVNAPAPTRMHMIDPLRAQAYVAGLGWLPPVQNFQVVGTGGQSRNLQALRLNVPQYPEPGALCGQAVVEGLGQQAEVCHTPGSNVSIQLGAPGRAIRQVRFRRVSTGAPQEWTVCYSAHVSNVGWMPKYCDYTWAGSLQPGQNIEAVRIWWERTVPPSIQ